MIVLFLIVLLICVAAVFALWAARLPGGLTLDLGNGAVYEFELVYALLALILLGAAMALIWSFMSGIITLPRRFSRSRKASRVETANKALADGLLAAEAGDALLAKKLSKKAAQHASDDRMKLLLEARTAEISDDWSAAERAWGQLARLPGGQLAGLRGAASAASARGDALSAEARAREALELKTAADWPFNTLFDSQVAAGHWRAALETLILGEKRGHISGDSLRRRRAVLYTALSTTLPNEQRKDAQRLLAEAIKAAPSFPPAAWHGARQLMSDAKIKAAQGVLELGWKARPHPALAQLSRRLTAEGGEPAANGRLKALTGANPDHRESRILKAELAMSDRDWLTAVKELALLVEEKPTARLCLLLAKALTGYGDRDEAARWRGMASTAAREPEWSDMDPRGQAFTYRQADWSRLVYEFGDTGRLIHPRYEASERELEAGRPLALPGKAAAMDTGVKAPAAASAAPPLDYAAPDKD
ncbi:heme biosynthesis HemY N-terminal domain-containing protein [Hyphomonas sp. FCG-A18]|uniref:heme biosynthesis protein HemY n=1 Tax=Hyphomonas sp. FCG-A18 TaxID=3080019 RepID=UPI002B2B241B|nr:heme biosynthesis HemY N-terminal domain-containing protein [Hyphomonas sp. FCG-A18]